MKKEIGWAIGFGAFFGLIIAFGAWRINSNLRTVSKIAPTPAAITEGEFLITLDKPEDGDVEINSEISVSGITRANTLIVVSAETQDYLTYADGSGVFSQNIGLTGGINQIKITAIDESKSQSVQKVLVIYSPLFQTKTLPTPENSTNEADVRQKVQEKVQAALARPKAYLGAITDITDGTVQLKTARSEIKQISIDAAASVIKNTDGASRVIKAKDLAIGDFIVAMGYVNSSSVLSAQRILVTNPPTEPKLTVKIAAKKDLSDLTVDKTTGIFIFKTAPVKTKLADIKNEDELVIVSDESAAVPRAKTIFVIRK